MKIKEDLINILNQRESARLIYNSETLEILGLFYEWRKENPNTTIGMYSPYRTITIGANSYTVSIKEDLEKLGLTKLHQEMIKRRDKREAKEYAEAEILAMPILDTVEKQIKEILAENSCSISYMIGGDMQGIDEDYQYISVCVNGYGFERKL